MKRSHGGFDYPLSRHIHFILQDHLMDAVVFILFYKISFGCSRLHFILQNQLLDAVVFILFYKILYWADAELQPSSVRGGEDFTAALN